MTAIEKAAAAYVALFLKEVGYHEKASNAQLDDPTANSGSNNWNKFAAHIDSFRAKGLNFYNGKKNIGPQGEWCDISFDDTMIRLCQSLGMEELEAAKMAMRMLYQPSDSCGAGCCYSADYYRAAGAWIERSGTPKAGDQFFTGPRGDESHTGCVVKVDSDNVYTVEGNANNQVMERKYARSNTNIAGYGRPNYALIASYFEEEKPVAKYTTEADVEKLIKKNQKPLTRDEVMKVTGDKWIHDFNDLPPWAMPEVKELIQMGALKGVKLGKTPEETIIDAPLNGYIRPILVSYRAMQKLIDEMGK